ncbi:dihydrofolate reductase [Escherichia coli]|uniref:dihydrofolate reductase n=1 Tax=Escherichia coli TaxID=562 RepID=UPI001FF4D77F|nr:dihydrofolate reductase [Escherichia coli]
MQYSLIYGQLESNGAIGLAGNHPLPWHYSKDLIRFKELTMGKPMVMGRNTFESLPGMLPGRHHLVLSHDPDKFSSEHEDHPQLNVVTSIKEATELVEKTTDEIFLIGGVSVIEAGLYFADRIYRTIIRDNIELDGELAVVSRPGENGFDLDVYTLVDSYEVDSLVFETWHRRN